MCIKTCLDADQRYWTVGDIFQGVAAPTKHFKKITGKNPNPLAEMRKKLENLGIHWSPDWSLHTLQKEVGVAEDFLRRKDDAERRKENETKIKREV